MESTSKQSNRSVSSIRDEGNHDVPHPPGDKNTRDLEAPAATSEVGAIHTLPRNGLSPSDQKSKRGLRRKKVGAAMDSDSKQSHRRINSLRDEIENHNAMPHPPGGNDTRDVEAPAETSAVGAIHTLPRNRSGLTQSDHKSKRGLRRKNVPEEAHFTPAKRERRPFPRDKFPRAEAPLLEATLVEEDDPSDILVVMAEPAQELDKQNGSLQVLPVSAAGKWLCLILALLITAIAITGITCGSGLCGDDGGSTPEASNVTTPAPLLTNDTLVGNIFDHGNTTETTPSLASNTTSHNTQPNSTSKQGRLRLYEGQRLLNGFAGNVTSRRNATTGEMLLFSKTQLQPMSIADTAYFSTVVNGGTVNVYLLESLHLPDNYAIQSLQRESSNPNAPLRKALDWISRSYSLEMLDTMEGWRKHQLYALACVYYSFDGDTWDIGDRQEWLNPMSSECDWTLEPTAYKNREIFQIQCDESQVVISLDFGHITDIDSGTIPPEVAMLSSLEYLAIGSSPSWSEPLDKVVPTTLRYMKSLETLLLSDSNLQGTIPPSLFSRLPRNMTHLSLAANSLSGSLPSEVATLSALTQLHLGGNLLSGALPTELGLLAEMETINLSLNNFHHNESTILSEFAKMTLLRDLMLHDASIAGTIPTVIGLLTALTQLKLGANQFSGSICQPSLTTTVCQLLLRI
ncbi:LRR receptor-like serine threonine-protein kinase [Seminavis robusta]|uniref:LRR receptor-like serine threonine-protein kinase n=1 Tax=Seminavis robusta TaxID=568900 RepID=A0A9N8HYH5_9STRA|nr:LRR receptor-like serine threonine-protein kinase [Seminavis robusta]|eukprot:Sro1997_g310110.1 LRR receptor-like serine threonine-protein kinase (685) ;mRNA; r:16817-19004